jgi:hypothetical protein
MTDMSNTEDTPGRPWLSMHVGIKIKSEANMPRYVAETLAGSLALQ